MQNDEKHKNSEVFSFRTNKGFLDMLNNFLVSNNISLTKGEFLELITYIYISNMATTENIEGISIKDLATVRKFKKLRSLQSEIRTEFLSSAYFIQRCHKDIFRLIFTNKSINHKSDIDILELVNNYLIEREKEIGLFKNQTEVIMEFNKYKEMLKKSELDKLTRYAQDSLTMSITNKKEIK